ncbi:MAG: hypothetical protein KI790_21090, partial [Cyclobacteriaceae bacterium]|nr:hypothetical protein [Cyclobacteriaceae bacterium HetDA_MAG_MS6]
GEGEKAGKEAVETFSNLVSAEKAFNEVRKSWHTQIEGFQVKTPDPLFDSMLNTWAPYNCLITYFWSRAASLVYNGERDGLGYRDSVQDVMGTAHLIPEKVKERLRLMISGQVSTGGAIPVIKPFSHRPGQENPPSPDEYRSDDCLWLFNAVPLYVGETGDTGFYQEVVPFADEGEATVLGHLRRAIEFNLARMGQHGLPCGLLADWNDCLELGQNGETVFVAFQLRLALKVYAEISVELGEEDERQWAQEELVTLDKSINDHAWDGQWFLRAYRYDGLKFGSKENDEGSIFMNPQVWSVISDFATDEQKEKALNAVRDRLATDYGVMVCTPPFVHTDYKVIRATLMNPGMKENGGIFNHTQGWAIIAEAMRGNGDQAYQYFTATSPASYNDKAEVREVEPYVVCQSTHSKFSPRFGASRVPWLSGAATWLYYAATQYILGIRPVADGIIIDPAIPSHWDKFEVERRWRGKTLSISVQNPNGVQRGVTQVKVNGETSSINKIPEQQLQQSTNLIEVVMG